MTNIRILKIIEWENLELNMEVLYLGPGDAGSIGWVNHMTDDGYLVLSEVNHTKHNLYIADGRLRVYQPDASLAEVEWSYLKEGMTIYYKDEYEENDIYTPGVFRYLDYTGLVTMCCTSKDESSIQNIIDEPEFFYFKDLSKKISDSDIKKDQRYNIVCPLCGAPAYQGLVRIECSKGCK